MLKKFLRPKSARSLQAMLMPTEVIEEETVEPEGTAGEDEELLEEPELPTGE